jgi:putative transposase
MPDHIHLLITPNENQSLELCVQCVKGGFSFAIRKSDSKKLEVWQRSFHEHRVRDLDDYIRCQEYIARNPEKRGLRDHAYVGVRGMGLDEIPKHLRG